MLSFRRLFPLLFLVTVASAHPAQAQVKWLTNLEAARKQAAQSGAWRTPETTLLVVGLLGGWPGALVARAVCRHKTRKQPFVTLFWLTVAVHCAALAWAATTGFPR